MYGQPDCVQPVGRCGLLLLKKIADGEGRGETEAWVGPELIGSLPIWLCRQAVSGRGEPGVLTFFRGRGCMAGTLWDGDGGGGSWGEMVGLRRRGCVLSPLTNHRFIEGDYCEAGNVNVDVTGSRLD